MAICRGSSFVGQRQLVEIMRALKSGVRVLALDEPTSSLTEDEVQRLFTLVRRLRDEAWPSFTCRTASRKSASLADRVGDFARWQAGRSAAGDRAERRRDRALDGRPRPSDAVSPSPAVSGREVLRVLEDDQRTGTGASASTSCGEVVGFAGLVGAGRSELAKRRVWRAAHEQRHDHARRQASVHSPPGRRHLPGIGFAPEDRKREGLILIRSVLENASLAIPEPLSRFHFVRSGRERSIVTGYVQRLRVRPQRRIKRSASCQAATSRRSCSPAGWRPSRRC